MKIGRSVKLGAMLILMSLCAGAVSCSSTSGRGRDTVAFGNMRSVVDVRGNLWSEEDFDKFRGISVGTERDHEAVSQWILDKRPNHPYFERTYEVVNGKKCYITKTAYSGAKLKRTWTDKDGNPHILGLRQSVFPSGMIGWEGPQGGRGYYTSRAKTEYFAAVPGTGTMPTLEREIKTYPRKYIREPEREDRPLVLNEQTILAMAGVKR